MKQKNYPIYRTTFIDDMRSLVEEAAANFPDKTALSFKEKPTDKEVKKVSFPQWRDDVRDLGTALISKGLRKKNIALLGENSYGWCCAFFAIMASGAVVVPVDKDLAVEDIMGIIGATQCEAVIFGRTAESKMAEMLGGSFPESVKMLVSIPDKCAIDAAAAGTRSLVTLRPWRPKAGSSTRVVTTHTTTTRSTRTISSR